MAVIKTGNGGSDQWTIDPLSKAGRVTLYDAAGNVITTVPVSLATTPLPANAAQEAGGHLASVDTKLTTTANGLRVDNSTVTQPVSGSVSVSNLPATQAVSGSVAVTNFPANQVVNQGSAGIAAWKVDGSAVTQPVAGTVAVSNLPATQPVSGTVAVSNLPTTQVVTSLDGSKPSYAASTASLAIVTGATDVFTLYGSNTKTIRVLLVTISLNATTATTVPVSFVRRSTANTGGTSAVPTITSFDTTSAAPTATAAAYTANPTALGTTAGLFSAARIAAPVAGGPVQPVVFEFGKGARQAIVLRGASQGLAINCNATALTGGSACISIEFTEE